MANIENLSLPLLFPTITEKWPCQAWNFDYLSEILDSKLFSCRVSEKSCGQKMETHYDYHMITIKQFNEWLHGDSRDGPLVDYCREKYSCYIDYKYMKDMFSHIPHIFKEVQWSAFGLQDFDGYDSTIWLGSEGANTPGHQDTYGFNLVVQIYGRKLWILFPPEDSQYLYPTRIPYEESSIFTLVNLRSPDLIKHPKFKFTHPVIVELCPGQTLYVPRHWWHYVESLEPSISVNIWVPLKFDCQSHVTEAVTRCLITGLLPTLDLSENNLMKANWINPKETLDSMDVNLTYLNTALSLLMKRKREITEKRLHAEGEIIERKFQETSKEQSAEIDKENSSAASLCPDPEVHLPGKDYLKILYTKLKTMSLKQGPSPFHLCYGNKSHIKRKSSSIRRIAKIQKQSDHQIPSDETDKKETFDKVSEVKAFEILCDAKQQSKNNDKCQMCDKKLEVSGLECGSKRDLSIVYALNPCSVESYLTFVHGLCLKNNCQCLAGGASNVAVTDSLTDQAHGSTAPQFEFPDSWKGEQDLQSKEPPINSAQTSSLFHSVSQTLETDLDITEQIETRVNHLLDEQNIAENLLACVLHPDVVNILSEKLVEMCLESNKS